MLRRHPRKAPSADRLPFCPICGLWPHLCVCPQLPELDCALRFVVVQHVSEARRQSNTGRLTARLVAGSVVVPWGWPDRPFTPSTLADPETDYRVLYPRPQSRDLSPTLDRPTRGRRLALVLLDGTWSQTRSMARRVPGLADLSFVRLPDGPPPSWELRRSPDRSSYCTLEAAVRAVEVLQGDEAARPMRAVMERVMTRSLHMRGKIRRGEFERRDVGTAGPDGGAVPPRESEPR